MTSTPNPGTPPPSVRANKEYRRQLLEETETNYNTSDEESNNHVKVEAPTPDNVVRHVEDPVRMLEAYFERQNPLIVEIETEHFNMHLPAALVSVNEHAIAFFIARDHVGFEPKVSSELKLTVNRRTYNVIYAGGAFTFRDLPYRMLSFMRIEDEENQDGEESSS